MKGRKPEQKARRRGTQHHRKSTDVAPAKLSGAITQSRVAKIPLPPSVPKTKAVVKLWRVFLSEIARHELRAGDLPLVEAMFVAKVRHAEAGAYVRKYGLMVQRVIGVTKAGEPIVVEAKNPMLAEERQQAIIVDRLAQRFGLSPEARIRLDLMQVAGATLLASLRTSLDEVVDAELADQDGEVVDAELAD